MRLTMRMAFAALFAMLFPLAGVSAFNAGELVDGDVLSYLKENGSLERLSYKESSVEPSLTPRSPLAEKVASSWPEGQKKPVFVDEELYLVSKSQLGSGNAALTTIDYASKILRSISKMQGLRYYSHTEKKWDTLYKEAYCIKGAKDRIRVDDDVSGTAEGKVVYCMQKDNSFGKIYSRVTYHQRPDEVCASFVNVSDVYVGPIKAIDEGNLRINIVIMDCGEDMLVYMLVQSEFPALKILEKTMYNSFSARLDAIYTWFCGQFL